MTVLYNMVCEGHRSRYCAVVCRNATAITVQNQGEEEETVATASLSVVFIVAAYLIWGLIYTTAPVRRILTEGIHT